MNTSLSDASFTASGGATDVPSQDPLGRVPQQSSQLSHPAPSAASASPQQLEAEAKLRAELARAERESQQAQQGAGQRMTPPTAVRTQPMLPVARTPPPTGAAPTPPTSQGAARPPVEQPTSRQRQLAQQKYAAINPARPPARGAPRVTATVLSARNLPVTERFGVPSPYVIMAIGNAFHKTDKTGPTLEPTWGQSFDFSVNPSLMQGQLLTLTVEDFSAALRDEPIGQLSIPLLQLMMRSEWDGWFDLRSLKSTQASKGTPAVQLKLQYFSGDQVPK